MNVKSVNKAKDKFMRAMQVYARALARKDFRRANYWLGVSTKLRNTYFAQHVKAMRLINGK